MFVINWLTPSGADRPASKPTEIFDGFFCVLFQNEYLALFHVAVSINQGENACAEPRERK